VSAEEITSAAWECGYRLGIVAGLCVIDEETTAPEIAEYLLAGAEGRDDEALDSFLGEPPSWNEWPAARLFEEALCAAYVASGGDDEIVDAASASYVVSYQEGLVDSVAHIARMILD
jgi:hypothetical protein